METLEMSPEVVAGVGMIGALGLTNVEVIDEVVAVPAMSMTEADAVLADEMDDAEEDEEEDEDEDEDGDEDEEDEDEEEEDDEEDDDDEDDQDEDEDDEDDEDEG